MKVRGFLRPRQNRGLRRFTPERAKATSRSTPQLPILQAGEKVTVAFAVGALATLLVGVGRGFDAASWAGAFTLVVTAFLLFSRYLVGHRREALATLPRVVALGCVLLMPLALLGMLEVTQQLHQVHFLPLSLFGLVLGVAWGPALATDCLVFLGVLCSLFLVVRPGAEPAMGGLVVSWVGGLTAALSSGHLKRRMALVRVGTVAGLAAVVVAAALGLLDSRFLGAGTPGPSDFVLLALEGLAVGLITSGSLPAIESAFGVTTDVSLLELGNTHEKPLLRKLLLEAPGTFHHSYIVGLISEAAAEAVGADALLTRVGSLYHDVGKLNKPGYFIENDPEASKRHKALTPEMSTLIISSHPRDGIEIGTYYGLPKAVLDFMPEHHGTSCIEYFYHAARKKRGEENVDESSFRYPGPRPQRIETAIVMIADAVEAIARQMKEPTRVRMAEMVHEVAMKRLMDRQFDECGLTLRQLERIEEAMVRVLAGIYHTRQTYEKRRPHPLDLSQPAEERRAAREEEERVRRTSLPR